MTVLEKIKRCVSLVWDFQEIYCEEDIEEFCHNELHTYPQHDEIMEYFKHIEECEKCYSLARAYRNDNEKLKAQIEKMKCCVNCKYGYCGTSSISTDENGNKTFHNWNKEKQEYCDIGKNGKYQCWELAE